MSVLPDPSPRDSFGFGDSVAPFLTSPELPFAKVLTEGRIERIFAKHNGMFGRTYTTAVVLWAFMGQVLRDGKEASCQSAVTRISSFLQLSVQDDLDPDTRDYCRARAKLSEDALHELATEVAYESEAEIDSKHLFGGRHAKLIDGSTFMMPDTKKNQLAYPQNPAQKPGIGFPIARFVVVLSLATACVIDVAIGKYKGKATGETALLRQLLTCFQPGDVAVADRFYGNYWVIALLMEKSVDVCFRKHQARRTDFRTGKRLGKNDHLVTWKRPARPAWMSQEMAAISATLHDRCPRRISFVNTCQFVLSAWDVMASGLIAATAMLDYCVSRFKQISKCIVGDRPGRIEPRVLKKRQKTYNLMMQPRAELHRRLAAGDNSFETK